jgi:hypothetical protein
MKIKSIWITFPFLFFLFQSNAKAAILGLKTVIDTPLNATFLVFFDGAFTPGSIADSLQQVPPSINWKLLVSEQNPAGPIQGCNNAQNRCLQILAQHLVAPHPDESVPGPILGSIFVNRFAPSQGGGQAIHPGPANDRDVGFGTFDTVNFWTVAGAIIPDGNNGTLFRIQNGNANIDTPVPLGTQWILRSDLAHVPEPSLALSVLEFGLFGLVSTWRRRNQKR